MIARGRRGQLATLRVGAIGAAVIRLQASLNNQLTIGTLLQLDAIFGPITQTQVRHFQRRVGLAPDGVVGRKTWYQLVATPPPEHLRRTHATFRTSATATIPQSDAQFPTVPQGDAVVSVVSWPLWQRFEYVVVKTGDFLKGDFKAQWKAMTTGKGLAILVGTLVVWAGGHAFGVSEATDAFLFGFGLAFLGRAAITTARLLKNFLELTLGASVKPELDIAAQCLSQAVSIIGVVAFFLIVAKVGRAIGKRFRTGSNITPPAVERALRTQENVQGEAVTRSIELLERPGVFRHTINNSTPFINFARILRDGFLRFSTSGRNAQYGVGVYAWEANFRAGVLRYVDIEVPPGTAAELLITQAGRWYRLIPAEGETLPVKVVGHNFTDAEVSLGQAAIGPD